MLGDGPKKDIEDCYSERSEQRAGILLWQADIEY